MNQKVLDAIGNNKRGMITLGGFGGYVTVGFDHTIQNVEGLRDFRVLGNAFYANANPNPDAPEGGSCEPGGIMVAYDPDNLGPDNVQWYEKYRAVPMWILPRNRGMKWRRSMVTM